MHKSINELICVKCKSGLKNSILSKESIACNNCGNKYPIISGNIVLLTDNPAAYISENFHLYTLHIKSQKEQVDQLAQDFLGSQDRANVFSNLYDAMQSNIESVNAFNRLLLPHVAVEELVKVEEGNYNGIHSYLNDFAYLRRDWCWHPEGEQELGIINQAVKEVILQHAVDRNNTLILGAGLGRIAWDLTEVFDSVYATDKSFSMAYHFHEIQKNDIYFYEINNKNTFSNLDITRRLRATINPPVQEPNFDQKSLDRIFYFISAVEKIPLPDNSLSSIISIYFTDVMALKLWLPEVVRLLKKGGLFFHYGPLGYPFQDYKERLSAEDVKAIFIKNGFEIVTDTKVISKHLNSDLNMFSMEFNNWVFAAIKVHDATKSEIRNVEYGSVLFIPDGVQYEIKGSFTRNVEKELETKIILPSDEILSGTEAVL